jgi:hypothetical protein
MKKSSEILEVTGVPEEGVEPTLSVRRTGF